MPNGQEALDAQIEGENQNCDFGYSQEILFTKFVWATTYLAVPLGVAKRISCEKHGVLFAAFCGE